MAYLVKEVATLVGISVRTLHHYDEIGLLKPGSVSPAGYRLYKERELERLQQILLFRELGVPLQEIRQIIDRPDFDRKQALAAHRELLLEKQRRLAAIVATLDRTIEAMEGGRTMSGKDMFEGFDETPFEEHKRKYAAEARERYGEAAVEAAEERAAAYGPNDWAFIKERMERNYAAIIEAMDGGPGDPRVQEAVADLRQGITDTFYDCTPDIFRGLGDLYVQDERFTANIDKYKEGLAAFLREAIHVYCDRLAEQE
ncbi:MerR family transcriptional regulator [Paenibacillus sp. J31TS4]|uniref:MerR family transcriptional regulator n=1 Tax=Paenibacillus sp. J31TS4 TaxID=2807195 RepID=UPI001B0EADA7|nr:MerR family transcriptional regulator [Paenibacillus sp. J31TS4]GIP41045.1 MerR family transcriptional regulator [Paenibacillus sp. J31TS4]